MSSSDLPVCAFCTFVNALDAKICVICQKSLHLPVVQYAIPARRKTCPECLHSNELSDNVCQICGATLVEPIPAKQEQNAVESPVASTSNLSPISNPCSNCGVDLDQHPSSTGNEKPKVCKSCTYENLTDATKCLICESVLDSSEKDISNKVCPFCLHDNAADGEGSGEAGVACTRCTLVNSPGTSYCTLCEEHLKSSAEEPLKSSAEEPLESSAEEPEPMDTDSDSMEDSTINDVDTGARVRKYEVAADSFEVMESAPPTHNFFNEKIPAHSSRYVRAVTENIKILKKSVPPGVWIKAYEDRMDLLTFMIRGPCQTPYEDGLFVFDICLPHNFPNHPPRAHYISFWYDRLNPNLYVEGKVCVSLLGTWVSQNKEEKWGPKSTLLQLIVSIQGLILVEEPYFNEPGYEVEYGTEAGKKNSDAYNEMVLFGMIESTTTMIENPPIVFKKELLMHFSKYGRKLYERLEKAMNSRRNPDPTSLEMLRTAIERICE